MYYVLMTTAALLFAVIGAMNTGVMFTAMCIFGGVLFGHVLTEALNHP
jgi:uncharacterized membrane protein YuzA (DUF378 family)